MLFYIVSDALFCWRASQVQNFVLYHEIGIHFLFLWEYKDRSKFLTNCPLKMVHIRLDSHFNSLTFKISVGLKLVHFSTLSNFQYNYVVCYLFNNFTSNYVFWKASFSFIYFQTYIELTINNVFYSGKSQHGQTNITEAFISEVTVS